MFSWRDLIVFLAGAEFFHTIAHIILPHIVIFPLHFKHIIFTKDLNALAIVVNGVITLLLLWWAYNIKPKRGRH